MFKVQSLLNKLKSLILFQVDLKYLHLNAEQTLQIQATYDAKKNTHILYDVSDVQQANAQNILGSQGLDVIQLKDRDAKDLGNRWSKRWSSKNGKGEQVRD